MNNKINWGIIAPGVIANKFAEALKALPEAELLSVASRSSKRGEAFAEKYGIKRIYDNYERLAEDADIDVAYIANPHSHHKEAVLMCLERGKAVLCEKPIAINEADMQEMVNCARRNNTFLMEAMWTRFLPAVKYIKGYIQTGALGDIRLVKVNFGFPCDNNPNGRLLNPNLAGGALLDIGIYNIHFTDMIYNKYPKTVKSLVSISDTGVDEESEIILEYGKGERANLSLSIRSYLPNDAVIAGTKGIIKLEEFYKCVSASVYIEGKEIEKICMPFLCNGYEYEAMEVMECLREGKTESAYVPHSVSLRVLRLMDGLRNSWKLSYPMEDNNKHVQK